MSSKHITGRIGLVSSHLFLILILFVGSGCSDDDPVQPTPDADISGTVLSPGGDPAPGATVYLGRDPEFLPFTATVVFDSVLADASGNFLFDGLDSAFYRVYAGLWNRGGGDFSQVSPFSGPLQVGGKTGGHVAHLPLHDLDQQGVVAGEVFYEDGTALAPADSAEVTLYRYVGLEMVVAGETEANAAGAFALPGVPTGNYVVDAQKKFNPETLFPLYLAAESEAFFCDGKDLARVDRLILRDVMVEKPAVYIYPQEAGRFAVALEFGPGVRLAASEPEYGEGWNVFVDETGLIDGDWDYLFYEVAMRGAPRIVEGWCLSWSELGSGLEAISAELGLTAAERNDFLSYWISRLPRREYYEIHPVTGSDLDAWVELDVQPAPDSVLRFWLFFQGRDHPTGMAAPPIVPVARTGTTVVEWGGAVIP